MLLCATRRHACRAHARAMHFVFSSAMRASPERVRGSDGHDAVLGSDCCLAVADGVGGWEKEGVDPAAYSRGLISSVGELVSEHAQRDPWGVPMQDIPSLVAQAQQRIQTLRGSCTMVLATLSSGHADSPTLHTAVPQPGTAVINDDSDGRDADESPCRLNILNLGDSGFMYLSADGKKRVFSEAQVHDFNFPFQLGSGIDPEDGTLWVHGVRPKDFVLLFTDGVSGNLHHSEISQICDSHLEHLEVGGALEGCPLESSCQKVLDDLVEDLLDRAFRVSQDKDAVTPFAEEYSQLLGESYRGGKPDDMAVVAALVVCDPGDEQWTE